MCRKSFRSSSSRREESPFTLVELLVVIAIVAILAAMLLSTLNRARNSAMETDCIARKKELMQCIGFYTDDHDGYLPGGRLYGGQTLPKGVIYPVLLADGYLGSEAVLAKLSHCTMTEHTAQCRPHLNEMPGPSAGVNANFRLSGWESPIRRPYKKGSIRHPSALAYLSDTRGWAFDDALRGEDGKVAFQYRDNGEHFGFFHAFPEVVKEGSRIRRVEGRGRAVVSFLDGHTSSLPRTEVLGQEAESPFYNPAAQ